MMKNKRAILFLIIGLVLGALSILAVRYFTYSPHHTHYHANFAVYINGVREEFKDPSYYQEVSICSLAKTNPTPQARVHLHDEDNNLVHIHDDAVTWGHLFENLGWYVGPDFIQTKDGTLYKNSDTAKLTVIVDGLTLPAGSSIARQVIGDQSHVLISYGSDTDATLKKQYDSIPSTAAHADTTPDPASCSGGDVVTPSERFENLF